MPHHCWWYWRNYKRQDYSNVELGLYVKIIYVNYDMKLFTFAENCFRGFKHIKHCFLVISLFCCLSVCDFDIRMCSVRHRPKDFSANFGSKSLSLFGWRQGGEAGQGKQWQTVTREGGGIKNRDFYGDILFEWPLRHIRASDWKTLCL